MAYNILAKDGRPIKKDGDNIKAMDFTVEKIEQLNDTEKSFIAVASTEHEDRDKDIIRQDGWNLKNFKKNPVVPWSHNYWGIPIAKSLRTWVDKKAKQLMFKPQFDSDDDESIKIFNKYKNGFLTSFSVGFRGIDFEWRDDENRWGGGMEFKKQELLEISGVTVPANPNATVSLNGMENSDQNLLQLGYVSDFVKTASGLFYPVRQQLAEYYKPEVKQLQNKKGEDIDGVQVVSAFYRGDSDDEVCAVGYFFDPEKWSTGDVHKWVSDNNEPTYKQFYYDWKTLDEGEWEVKVQEEDADLPVYDEEPKVLTTEDVADDDETDVYTVDDKTDDDSDVTIDPVDDKSDDEDLIEFQEEVVRELGTALEKMMSEQMLKMAESLAVAFDSVFDKILVELDGIKKLINEKEVDSPSKIDDNDDESVDDPDESKSQNDDEVEIDDSLISPNDDKSNSDDIIEIDEDDLGEKNVAKTVNTIFRQKLKEIFNKEKEDKVNIKL